MVKRTRPTGSICIMVGCAMAGASAGIGGTPAIAQDRPGSLLERMQDEVAAVARQSRAAIVTIEDSRAITLNYSGSALRQADLKDQIAHLQIDIEAANKEVARRQQLFNAGTLTLSELEQPRREQARLEARLAYLRARLANVGVENAQTQHKEELKERVTELQSDYEFLGRQVKSEQNKVNVGAATTTELSEAQRQLAHTKKELETAQMELSLASVPDSAAQLKSTLNMQLYDKTVYRFSNSAAPAAALQTGSKPKSGSGFSIGDRLIVTTADVVQGMSNPVVIADDGRQARASVVAVDSRLNIALLRLNASLNLPALRLGDSANVAPGHFAITMGNQTGQANSVALSTISALRTQGTTSAAHYYPELLQIDGTVSAGTSGAPVLNARGEVIGMLAAMPAAAPGADVFGLAPGTPYHYEIVPGQSPFTPGVSYRYELLPGQILQRKDASGAGTLSRALPATPAPKSGSAILNDLLVVPPPVQPPASTGPPSTGSTPDSPPKPSDRAALPKSGSRSIRMFGTTGQTLGVHFNDSNQTPTYVIQRVLDAPFITPAPATLPASSSSGYAIPVNAMKSVLDELKTGHNVVHAWLGLSLEDADNARYENGIVSVDRQVKVAGVYDRSPASKAGLTQTGDILTGLNDIAVHTSNDVRAAVLLRFKPGQSVTAHLLRAGKSLDVSMTLEAAPTDVPPLLRVGSTATNMNLRVGHAEKLP